MISSLLPGISGLDRKNSQLSLRMRLVTWNVIAMAILLAVLGVVVRYAVNSLLLISVNRRLEREVQFTPAPIQFRSMRNGMSGNDDFDGTGDGQPGPPPPDVYRGLRGGPPPGADRRPQDIGQDGPPPERPKQALGAIPAPSSQQGDSSYPVEPYAARHFDLEGRPLGSRGLLDPSGFAAIRQAQSEDYFSRIRIHGSEWQVLTRPYREDGKLRAIVQAGYPLTEVNEALHGLDSALLMMIPIGLLCAAVGGTYLTSHVLRSVRDTADAATRISISKRGDFSARLPVIGNDEFAGLAKTINELLGRLEGAFQQQICLLDQQKRFTADASHELKTPLTVIRGNASLTLCRDASPEDYRRSLQKIDKSAESMAGLIQDLLVLARTDSGHLSERIELPIHDVVTQAVANVRHAGFDGATVRVNVVCSDETLTVVGNEDELIRVFVNLLTNAIRYTLETGQVSISISKLEDYVRIRVDDTGIGIAPEHLPHLGERFYRVDSARARSDGGSGLGLSICKSIIEAHGGTIAIESILGKGTSVRIVFPLA